jgi:hypothetical protein
MIASCHTYECGDCSQEFSFSPGWPNFCPECGVEFNHLVTRQDKENGRTTI